MAKDLVGIDESGFEHRVFLDTDSSLTANSDEKVASQKAVKQYVDDNVAADSVKKYVALLTQTGTDAPVATVLENTLGGTMVWTRISEGFYRGTLAGAFTADKTTVLIQTLIADANLGQAAGAQRASADIIEITTGAITTDLVDGVLSGTTIEITVYP